MTREARVLVISKNADTQAPIFDGRFEGTPICFARSKEEMEDALREFQPTVVLAHHDGAVSKSAFQTALHCESVEWLSNGGAGVEHLGAWDPTVKTVTNASGVNARYLAEYTIAAIMAANIGLVPLYTHQQRRKHWERHDWPAFEGRRFCVVGLGNVGRAVAKKAKQLDMHVVGTRGTPRPTDHVDEVFGPDDLHAALSGSDFVSVHAAQTPETLGLIDDAAFDAMPEGVIFLNAARGPVVDEAALLRALDSGRIGIAILDVFATEPLPPENPLWEHDKVLVTPHMADSVQGWQEKLTEAFAGNLERWLAGEDVTNIVNPTLGY